MQAIDHLERYLVEAAVIQAFTHSMGGGGHPNSFVAILEGGVAVLVKTEEPTEQQRQMARREVAAWRLARMLEWLDLVSATVLRRVTSLTTGADVEASVQVIWANKEVGTTITEFDEDDVWRAATFDALVRQTDRSASNWLGVPEEASHGRRRPKLIDHGYAFDLTRQGPADFYHTSRGRTCRTPVAKPFKRRSLSSTPWTSSWRHPSWKGSWRGPRVAGTWYPSHAPRIAVLRAAEGPDDLGCGQRVMLQPSAVDGECHRQAQRDECEYLIVDGDGREGCQDDQRAQTPPADAE